MKRSKGWRNSPRRRSGARHDVANAARPANDGGPNPRSELCRPEPAILDQDPGSTHTSTIDWGDGTVEAGVVSGSGGSGTVSGSHVYPENGVYTVTVTVTASGGLSYIF